MVAVFQFPHLNGPAKSFHGIHVNKGIPSIWLSSEKMCQYCHHRDFFLTSVFLFALVGLKIAMDGNPIARKGSKFPSLKKFHRSQLIQNSNWKFHPLQICITSQFLNGITGSQTLLQLHKYMDISTLIRNILFEYY